MKVQNMTSFMGNPVPNQFIIDDENGNRFFQSYQSIIIKVSDGKTYLDEKLWNYSITTAKYRNLFLWETTNEVKAKIESGDYILTNLN